jgi:ribosomal protein S18 acetylase RimI-like enzyme
MRKLTFHLLDPAENRDWTDTAELFSRMYSGMMGMGLILPLAEEGTERWIKTARNTSGKFGIIILAKVGNKPVGFAHGMIKFLPDYLGGHPVGSITHVYVDDDLRLSGIGKTLVKMIEEWFHAKKVHSIELQVVTMNTDAQSFWKKLGYMEELTQYRKTC